MGLPLEIDCVVRTCVVLMAHLNKRGKSATRGATWDRLAPSPFSTYYWPVSCGRITVLPVVASAQGF